MEHIKTIISGHRANALLLFVCFILLFPGYSSAFNADNDGTAGSGDTIVGGYMPFYKINKVTPDIFDYLTHLYYFSLGPDASRELGRIDNNGVFTPLANLSAVDSDIETLLNWRGQKPVKIYLVVGGWVQSDYFDEAVTDSTSRANLVANIKDFCTGQGLDGVDLDWEPYHGDVDDRNYGLLISELRTAFNGTNLEISSAINPAHTSLIDAYADADFIQLMSYGKYFGENTQVPLSMLRDWVNGWINKGFSRSKLVIGLPAYGKTPSDYSSLLYRNILDLYNIPPDSDMVIHNNKTYYFNNVNTIIEKTRYMLDEKLKGVMFWELGQDITVNDPRSLLRNAYETIYGQTPVATGGEITISAEPILYPNPAQNTTNLQFNLNEPAAITLSVYNSYGEKVGYYHDFLNNGFNTLPITTQAYPSGVYLLRCNIEDRIYILKFIKN
jgi:hypothetical protein